jgi:hypothetical protein
MEAVRLNSLDLGAFVSMMCGGTGRARGKGAASQETAVRHV